MCDDSVDTGSRSRISRPPFAAPPQLTPADPRCTILLSFRSVFGQTKTARCRLASLPRRSRRWGNLSAAVVCLHAHLHNQHYTGKENPIIMPHLLSRLSFALFAAVLAAVCALCFFAPHAAFAAPADPAARVTTSAAAPPASAVLTPTLPFTRALDLRSADFPYLQAADGAAFNLNPDGMTIEFWVEIPVGYQSYTEILRKPGVHEVALRYEDGWIFFRFDGAGFNGGNRFFPGWHHLAVVVYMEGTNRIAREYIDGWLSAGGGGPDPITTSQRPLRVMQGAPLRIDELRISDGIRYGPTDFPPPTEPFACDDDTLALWRFDEDAGARVYRSDCGISADLTPVYELMLPLAAR